jgi:phage-related protein
MYNIENSMFKNDSTLFKKLQYGVWEFRTLHLRRHYRMIAFWDNSKSKNIVVVTHGLVKKSDKLPKHEIEKVNIKRANYYNQHS